MTETEHKPYRRLHCAAYEGDIATLKRLIADGANANEGESHEGGTVTPLYWAVLAGQGKAITALAKAGAHIVSDKVDYGPFYSITLLGLAARNGQAQAITALVKAGADVRWADELGATPMHTAAYNGHTQAVAALVKAGADVNAEKRWSTDPRVDGWTPLHGAALGGHARVIAALAEAGAKVNQALTQGLGFFSEGDIRAGWTPLHAAARNGHAQAIAALVKAGAKVNQMEGGGYTPLHLASYAPSSRKKEAVNALVKAGAKPTKRKEPRHPNTYHFS